MTTTLQTTSPVMISGSTLSADDIILLRAQAIANGIHGDEEGRIPTRLIVHNPKVGHVRTATRDLCRATSEQLAEIGLDVLPGHTLGEITAIAAEINEKRPVVIIIGSISEHLMATYKLPLQIVMPKVPFAAEPSVIGQLQGDSLWQSA